MAKRTKAQEAERQEAIAELQALLPKGSTVYAVIRSVSRSGMSRRIDLYTIAAGYGTDRGPSSERYGLAYLTGLASTVLGWSADARKGGLRVDGCGMDMCFHTVYNLSACLYGHEDRGGYALHCETL